MRLIPTVLPSIFFFDKLNTKNIKIFYISKYLNVQANLENIHYLAIKLLLVSIQI